jgi:hypothetical protein
LSTNTENSKDSRSFQSEEITFSQESSVDEIIEDGNSSNFFGTILYVYNQNVNIITESSIGALIIACSMVLVGTLGLTAIFVMRRKKRRMEKSSEEILGLF